jgi:hypothetical protein
MATSIGAAPYHSRHPEEGYTFAIDLGLFFSMYSKFVGEEDNKMVGRWQKEAEGIHPFAFGTTL